jgi:Tol biopolymer transport system component
MKKITTLLMLFFVAQNIIAQIPAGKKVISALYVYSSKTGKSELILREHRHFEAPNWSRDGKFLLINSLGY